MRITPTMSTTSEQGTLESVGLPPADLESWRERSSEFVITGRSAESLAADAARLADFCRSTDGLLTRLPQKPRRDPRETAAAEILKDGARHARTVFLRAYAEPIYRAITRDYADFVRAEELVYAAADRFPGLVPAPDLIARERGVLQKDKEGFEIDQGIFFSQILSHRAAGLHLVHAMLRPTARAEELLPSFRARARIDLGPVEVTRVGNAGHVTLRNTKYLNAEDDSTVLPMEIAVDLVLLDPAIEIGVLRGGVVDHPKYAGRRVFNAGINLTHLYHGRISFVGFYLARDLGFVNKFYRGLAGPEFLPDEPESTLEKPWISAVEAFAIGGGCQILLTMDRVIAERSAFFSLPARKEGIIPGAANLRLTRGIGDRLARDSIFYERTFSAGSPEGAWLCNEVVETGEMDRAIERTVTRLTSAGVVSAAANRKALRVDQEPIDQFRRYMALYAREQAYCHFSPALIRNLEEHWDAAHRPMKEQRDEGEDGRSSQR
ncbi:MAG TPA: enoyl-CoA hydratase/isomerase family protein [Gemmatimonadales bacterium]